MAEPVSLAEIKVHLRLDASETDEDSWLTALLIAARRACELKIDRAIGDVDAPLAGDDLVLVCQAIRLIVGTWYANREGATTEARSIPAEIPLSVTWILTSVRKWASD